MASPPTATRAHGARAAGLRSGGPRTWLRRLRLRERLARTPRELAVLLAVAGVLGVTWSVVLPPLQGPDEFTHVNYVQQLFETGRGPYPDHVGGSTVSTEVGLAQDILGLRNAIGNPAGRPAWSELEQRRWDQEQKRLTGPLRADGTGPSPLARNPQLYYAYEVVPYWAFAWSDLFDRLTAMRLTNVVLYVLAVLLTWLLAVEVLGRRARLGVLTATGIVALHPMLTFMGGVVNPDTGLLTGYTLVALCAARLIRLGPSVWRVLALFLAAGATLMVHGRGLAAVVVAAVALLLTLVVHRPPLKQVARWAAAVVAAGVALVGARLATSGGGLYDGEASLGAKFDLRQFLSYVWQFYFDRLSFMGDAVGPDYGYRQVVIERFVVGVFASLEVAFPPWVYDVAQYGVVLFVIVVWTTAVLHRDALRRAWPVLVMLATLVVALMLLLHVAAYRELVNRSNDPLITGRYLLPLAPVIALACGAFVMALPRAWRAATAGGFLSLVLLLQFGALGLTFIRFHV